MSSGRCQGIAPPRPITPLRATAAIRVIATVRLLGARSYGDGCPDAGVGVVADDRDVVEVEAVDVGDRGVELETRQRTRLAVELDAGLLEVVDVEVGIAERVHELAGTQPGHLR